MAHMHDMALQGSCASCNSHAESIREVDYSDAKFHSSCRKHVLSPQGWHWARLPPRCLATAPSQPAIIAEGSDADAQHASSNPKLTESQRTPGQVLLLCWTHAVIGFGFFGAPLV